MALSFATELIAVTGLFAYGLTVYRVADKHQQEVKP